MSKMLQKILDRIPAKELDKRSAEQRMLDNIPQQATRREYVILYYQKYPWFHVQGSHTTRPYVSEIVDEIDLAVRCHELISLGYELKIERL